MNLSNQTWEGHKLLWKGEKIEIDFSEFTSPTLEKSIDFTMFDVGYRKNITAAFIVEQSISYEESIVYKKSTTIPYFIPVVAKNSVSRTSHGITEAYDVIKETKQLTVMLDFRWELINELGLGSHLNEYDFKKLSSEVNKTSFEVTPIVIKDTCQVDFSKLNLDVD